MSQETHSDNQSRKSTKVGILLVHGIGETKKFEITESVVRNVATALQAENHSVRVFVNSSNDGAFRASQQTWMAQGALTIEVIKRNNSNGKAEDSQNSDEEVTELIFSEVWWADLGKSDTLKSQLSFWKWGLSIWSRKQFRGKEGKPCGTLEQVALPSKVLPDKTLKPIKIDLFARFRFFVVSWVVLLILPLLSFLSVIFRRVLGFNNIRPDILVQYLGDIKRYQQDKREGAGALLDLGQPPRITVRRRMIEGLVRMSLADYDRWYVLSHSLGTVVAFNGLMETDAALPNYLNRDLWEELQKKSKIKNALKLETVAEFKKLMEADPVLADYLNEQLWDKQKEKTVIDSKAMDDLNQLKEFIIDSKAKNTLKPETIDSLNQLIETDPVLVNYLNSKFWEKRPIINLKAEKPLNPEQEKTMFPSRPAGLELDDIIDRKDLFRNLRGFMTYGSPLSKLAVVWPAIVPINKNESTFSDEIEWINIYDPTDPVADKTKFFHPVKIDNEDKTIIEPREIAYKTESLHLLSHIKYLDFDPQRANPLVKQVANWLLTGEDFKSPIDEEKLNSSWGWPRDENKGIISFYVSIRYLIWSVTGILISWLLALGHLEK